MNKKKTDKQKKRKEPKKNQNCKTQQLMVKRAEYQYTETRTK